MAEVINLGVIGCGAQATGLTQHASATGLARIVAVFDIDEARSSALAKRHNAQVAPTQEALLTRSDVDAVMVMTPQFRHRQCVLASAAAGKHVFVEKPMALTTAACDEMIEAVAQAGTTLMVGHSARYREPFRTILHLSGKGRFGCALHAAVWRGGRGSWTGWKAKRELSGGFLYEIGCHELDFLLCLLGPPAAVHAVTSKTLPSDDEIEDIASVHIQFRSSAVGTFVGGHAFTGRDYGLCLRFENVTIRAPALPGDKSVTIESVEGFDFNPGDVAWSDETSGFVQMRQWLRSLIDGTAVPIPGESGRQTVAVVEAAYQSAGSGQSVSLP